MEDSLVDDDQCIEHDSLSSDSFSKDSLLNGHHKEEPIKRKGSYTLETSPQMSTSIRNSHLTQPIYVQTDNINPLQKSFIAKPLQKADMSQSLYERPWATSGRNSSISSANAKLRDEKLRLAKEEQQRKEKQKLAVLNESEKIALNARRRKEADAQKKIEDKRRKVSERQRIVDERKERLNKAEEERRKNILRKLVNSCGKKLSPQPSNSMMTMSCYGGFGSARSRPGNKEVVQNRFINNRPVSSTGKVIGFGSSTPRPICENTHKINSENKKISEAMLAKCEILSRPFSSRTSDKMMMSVISPQMSAPKTQRQSSLKEKDRPTRTPRSLTMTTSMIDFPPAPRSHVPSKVDSSINEDASLSLPRPKKNVDSRRSDIHDIRPSSALSNTSIKNEESTHSRKTIQSKSGTFTRRTKKVKVDTHLDSDSIEEEACVSQKQNELPRREFRDTKAGSRTSEVVTKIEIKESIQSSVVNDSSLQRALPTKDLSENEYKTRLMENRRLVREKREKERDQIMKTERDKRHAEEIAARENTEIERVKNTYIEDTHFTTSNDDALDGISEYREVDGKINCCDDPRLSEIAETPAITVDEPEQQSSKKDEEKNERKKKLDSIMSRVRKTNDESSSEGGMSPRRAMSPEPAELESETNVTGSMPAFRSSLLQSMMTKGRLSKGSNSGKDTAEESAREELTANIVPSSTGATLSSVRESMEDSESLITNRNSASSVAIRSSGAEGNSLSDANSEFAPEILVGVMDTKEDDIWDKDSTLTHDFAVNLNVDREDCDGKEDSLSLIENKNCQDSRRNCPDSPLNVPANCSSVSSTETEEEEIIKASFDIDAVYGQVGINSAIPERCVFQN